MWPRRSRGLLRSTTSGGWIRALTMGPRLVSPTGDSYIGFLLSPHLSTQCEAIIMAEEEFVQEIPGWVLSVWEWEGIAQ